MHRDSSYRSQHSGCGLKRTIKLVQISTIVDYRTQAMFYGEAKASPSLFHTSSIGLITILGRMGIITLFLQLSHISLTS